MLESGVKYTTIYGSWPNRTSISKHFRTSPGQGTPLVKRSIFAGECLLQLPRQLGDCLLVDRTETKPRTQMPHALAYVPTFIAYFPSSAVQHAMVESLTTARTDVSSQSHVFPPSHPRPVAISHVTRRSAMPFVFIHPGELC